MSDKKRGSLVETYDRSLEYSAARLAETRNSSQKDRNSFASEVLKNAKQTAEYVIAKRFKSAS